jgi:hypothetical protein
MVFKNPHNQPIDETIPSRPNRKLGAEKSIAHLTGVESASPGAPWMLQQFLNGEIDLDAELSRRFPSMPVLSSARFQNARAKWGTAALATQDSAATLHVDVNGETYAVEFTFAFRSMLALRFQLQELSDMDRSRWLESMRREQGGLSFLWGKGRWENNYVICAVHRYFTNIYAFSPQHFEAAARLTPEVHQAFLNWLDDWWKPAPSLDDSQKLITTW